MLLRDGAERNLDFVDKENGDQNFLASVALRVTWASGDLLICDIVVLRHLDDVFGTAFDVGHDREVWANGGCRFKTERSAYGTHCARVPRVEAAGVEIAQRVRHLFRFVERVVVGKGLTPLLNFWSADNVLFRLFSTLQVVIV